MFDIGFWELMILGLVALLVVGPERLPKLAYTAGKWIRKGRGMVSAVKAEIDKEIKAEELKQVLEEQKKKMNPLQEIVEESTEAVADLKNQTEKALKDAPVGNASNRDDSETAADQPDDDAKQTG
jgi:sec-independent protein translocase protein TatB